MNVNIGFVFLEPYERNDPYFVNYLKVAGYRPDQERLVSLDPYACKQYPEDGDYSYPIMEEYLARIGGDIRIFKKLRRALLWGSRELAPDHQHRCMLLAMAFNPGSKNESLFMSHIAEISGTKHVRLLQKEARVDFPVEWLGWDVTDIQGVSMVSSPAYLEASPDRDNRNSWGLLDDFSLAEDIAEFKNKAWAKNKSHGPVLEWRLGRIELFRGNP